MTLCVLTVAYPFAPVSFDTSGGAEQIAAYLDEALVHAGHCSVVVAREDSSVKGRLIPIPKGRGPLDERTRQFVYDAVKRAILQALKDYSIDVIHMHGVDFSAYQVSSTVPLLITLHLPLTRYEEGALLQKNRGVYFNYVSHSQEQTSPYRLVPGQVIGNGIHTERFTHTLRKRHYACSLGRICPEKGFHIALDAAQRAGIPLFLAGEVFRYSAHEHYYHQEILPRLDGHRYRYLGPVRFERKRRLLGAARCVLIPSLISETSSLVAMEALASGTPVIAFPAGALTEIVDHGSTGYLVQDEYEMAEAIALCNRIDADACREAAVKRFSSARMVEHYLAAYKDSIISQRGASCAYC